MSQRKTIREKIKSLLIDKTIAGSKVFENRYLHFAQNTLPAINISWVSENSSIRNTAPRQYERVATVALQCAVSKRIDLDDQLDVFAQEVENVMHADDTLGGTVADVQYTGTQMDINAKGGDNIGFIVLNYEITYFSYHGITATDDHLRNQVTFEFGEEDTKNIILETSREEQ